MITMQGSPGYFGDLGIDWSAAWDTAVSTAEDIVTSTPGAVVKAAEQNVTNKLTPIAQRRSSVSGRRTRNSANNSTST